MSAFLTQDPEGFLGGFLDDQLIATISAVQYSGHFGFISFYIVSPAQRGKGYGIRLWEAALKRLHGFNCGLDGVMAQIPNYTRSGFQIAHQNRRYSGIPRCEGHSTDDGIVDAFSLPIKDLAAFDRRYFPADRMEFLTTWISLPQRISRAFLREGRIA